MVCLDCPRSSGLILNPSPVVAAALAAVSAVFGLLAHVREMAMTCCSSCISGFAATVAFLAFVFDLAFFFVAKSRLNAVKGGSAEIGIAIWLTLAAWLLLFFSGCFYALGRCCISRRPRGPSGDRSAPAPTPANMQDDRFRLDAIKAESDRKALALAADREAGLPAFQEYKPGGPAEVQPLTGRIDGDAVYTDVPYHDEQPQYAGGYAPAPAGGRTIDQYGDQRRQPSAQSANTTYPPRRQASATTPGQQAFTSAPAGQGYTPYGTAATGAVAAAGAGAAAGYAANQYLNAGGYGGHQQYPSGGAAYGHSQDPTSCQSSHHCAPAYADRPVVHSAASHQQEPTGYSQYADPYAPQQQQPAYPPQQQQAYAPQQQQAYPPQPSYQQAGYTAAPYNQSAMTSAGAGAGAAYGQRQSTASEYSVQPAYTPPGQPGAYGTAPAARPYGARSPPPGTGTALSPERSYTLGGNGYGANVVPALHQSPVGTTPSPGLPLPYPGEAHAPDYHAASPPPSIDHAYVASPTEEPAPPHYDGPLPGSMPSANWGEKR
jgi:hypothetical protein